MAAAPPPSTLADLESYEVSPTTGFVPDSDPLIDLPHRRGPPRRVAAALPRVSCVVYNDLFLFIYGVRPCGVSRVHALRGREL